jgi:hypothetical protein
MSSFAEEMVPVEHHHLFFFQIVGRAAGRTELTAVAPKTRTPVADLVPIIVAADKRRLSFNAEPGSSPPMFDLMWKNHPLNPNNPGGRDDFHARFAAKMVRCMPIAIINAW